MTKSGGTTIEDMHLRMRQMTEIQKNKKKFIEKF